MRYLTVLLPTILAGLYVGDGDPWLQLGAMACVGFGCVLVAALLQEVIGIELL